MKRRIRPQQNGVIWNACDIFDEDLPDCYKSCWCQSFTTAYSNSICECDCHLDDNSRGVYGK